MKRAVILGTFDGLHKGHRAVIKSARGYEISAVTFVVPPKAVMTGKNELLMTYTDRRKGLLTLGVNEVVPLEFEKIRDMSAPDFLDMINSRFSPALIACGFNYRFGKGAEGDIEMLKRYCDGHGIELRVCEPQSENGETVSSSLLRELIKNGEMERASNAMAFGFSFTALVIDGDHRGRTIGFPTINQKYPDALVKPKFGVYRVEVDIDGEIFSGIANIGHRPTYETFDVCSETFIKNFSGNLYDRYITVKPVEFLRAERRFASLDELKTAIENDVGAIS